MHDDTAAPSKRRRAPAVITGACAAGLAVAAAVWTFRTRSQLRVERMRYESTLDVARLYALQLSYKKAHGVYAGDLDALISPAPDRAALKASLAADVDMSTLVVDGGARAFKIEVNVLDSDRTSIRVKGPVAPRRPKAAAAVLPAPAPPMNADGAPLAPGR